jgi:hypothetical protein
MMLKLEQMSNEELLDELTELERKATLDNEAFGYAGRDTCKDLQLIRMEILLRMKEDKNKC